MSLDQKAHKRSHLKYNSTMLVVGKNLMSFPYLWKQYFHNVSSLLIKMISLKSGLYFLFSLKHSTCHIEFNGIYIEFFFKFRNLKVFSKLNTTQNKYIEWNNFLAI